MPRRQLQPTLFSYSRHWTELLTLTPRLSRSSPLSLDSSMYRASFICASIFYSLHTYVIDFACHQAHTHTHARTCMSESSLMVEVDSREIHRRPVACRFMMIANAARITSCDGSKPCITLGLMRLCDVAHTHTYTPSLSLSLSLSLPLSLSLSMGKLLHCYTNKKLN